MKILTFLNEKLEISICVFLISFMTILIFIQVFMRYVMQSSLSWSEELARYVFIWLIYIGISYSAKTMGHIKIEAALAFFPEKIRPYITLTGDIFFLIFALFIFIVGTDLMLQVRSMSQYSSALRIPLWVVYGAPVCGYGLTALRQIQTMIYRVNQLKEGK